MLTKALKLKKLLVLLLVLVSLVSCASKNKIKSKQASLYFGVGTQSLLHREYTEALKSLLKANELEPDNSEILTNLAMAYYFKGEEDLSTRHLERALQLNPENSDARTNLASIKFNQGKLNDAERLYKEVLRDLTYDKQARTQYNLGMIELRRKNPQTAEVFFKKAIKEDENYCPSYYQLGLIQFHKRQFNTALRNFKEASMGTCYESPAPHYYQALALTELGKFEEARLKFDEIETRFKKTIFAVKARTKAVELNELEARRESVNFQATRKVLETPDF